MISNFVVVDGSNIAKDRVLESLISPCMIRLAAKGMLAEMAILPWTSSGIGF